MAQVPLAWFLRHIVGSRWQIQGHVCRTVVERDRIGDGSKVLADIIECSHRSVGL